MALVLLGLGLLLAPTSSCGPAVRAWVAGPLATPSDTPPQLDDDEVARDAQAVTLAQAALAAWRPSSVPPTPSRTTTRTRAVSAADPREVAAAQRRVNAAQSDVDADEDELDRLLAEQEASSDPGSYDADVAAARERLEESVATLDDAERDLATAKGRTRTVTETVPAAAPTTSAAPSEDRAALAAALADAKAQQAAHLAARQQAVADWRSGHQADVTRVAAHNARVKQCASRAAVPGGAGALCLLVAVLVGASHTVRGRLTP